MHAVEHFPVTLDHVQLREIIELNYETTSIQNAYEDSNPIIPTCVLKDLSRK